MHVPEIKNLKISQVTPNIWLVHQIETPFYFSCCDGLIILPKKDRNKKTVVIDLNIEPEYVIKISEIVGPISDYICSHGHLDHIAHVHAWENIGAKIHAPYPESENLLDE
ncbi:MAG: MBL fold metallo-hydrolase [Promethearchaeota archaeon]